MFKVAPKQVEVTTIPKKSRKNKELANEYFDEALLIIEQMLEQINIGVKTQDPVNPVERRKQLRNLAQKTKEAQKKLNKCKNIQRKTKRVRKSNNTGLEKPRPISKSFALFSGLEYGTTQKSRYDVTNMLCAYIKENELREEDNKTIITPDAKLKELLQIEDDVILKYPTMQIYLKNCFEEIEPEPAEEDAKKKSKSKPKEKVVEETKPKKTTKKDEAKPKKETKTSKK